jgi:prepilin-type N-terminal cleavage/methylation domain-containing protein
MEYIKSKKGFTLIEMIVVIAIMGILLGLAAPFTTSIRSDISMRKTVRQIKSDIVGNLGYSLAGKSINALVKDDLLNPEQIPSHYALYFQTDNDYGDIIPYQYAEFSTDIQGGTSQSSKVIYKIEKEMPNSTVYIKDIRLKRQDGDSGVSVNSAYVFFTPPFGKVSFLNNNNQLISGPGMSGSLDNLINSGDFEAIEFDFQYKDEEQNIMTLSFSNDKVINIY